MENIMNNHPLPALSAGEAKAANAQVRVNRLVFGIGGEQYCMRFEASMDAAIGLDVSINGKRGTIALCANSVNAVLTTFNTSLAQISQEWLLFALRAFAKAQFGAIVEIHGVVPDQVQPSDVVAFHLYTMEESSIARYRIGLGTGSQFSMEDLIDMAKKFTLGVRPSALEGVPIALPLIATSLSVEAWVLQDMAVGDVLFLGR